MTAIKVGNKTIKNFKSGGVQISKIYKGSTLLWENKVLKSGILPLTSKSTNGFGAFVGTNPDACFDFNTATYGYSVNSSIPTASCTFEKTVVKEVKITAGKGGGLSMNVYACLPDGTKSKWFTATLSAGESKSVSYSTTGTLTGLYVECASKQEQYLAGIGVTKWYEIID